MIKYFLENHTFNYLPKDKKWKMVWNDEFDGSQLDESKWSFRTNYWGYPSPTFTKEGVVLDGNSHLQLHLIEKDGNFYSPHLQTGSLTFDIPKDSKGFWPFGKRQEPKFMHKYGYYEICCKFPKNDGWHSAFWLQAPGIGSHPDPKQCGVEVDIIENYKLYTDNKIGCGNGWGGYGKDCKWYGHMWFDFEETDDGWHRYGVDWSKDGYRFYHDGILTGIQEAPVSDVEQFILVSTECHGYHKSMNRGGLESKFGVQGQPDEKLFKAVLPDYFEVDYVRVFDEVK